MGRYRTTLTLFPDGSWLTGRPFHKTPASIAGWNTGALAVEMLGNFDLPGTGEFNSLGYDKLEGKQREEILKLIKYFIDKYGEETVIFIVKIQILKRHVQALL